jgi:heme-degrading monooxygenase HmoA
MHIRMLHVSVRPGALVPLRRAYEREVTTALAGVDGCRYAGLFQDVRDAERCLSLTVWTEARHAEDYARSPLFERLIGATSEFFSESEEFTIRLSENLTIEEVHLPARPEVADLAVEAGTVEDPGRVTMHPGITVRTVTLSLRPGAVDTFVRVYREGAIPILRGVPGCQHVFLAVPAGAADEVMSVTLWSDGAAIDAYERSGLYSRLLQEQEDLLSPLYRAAISHQKEHHMQAASSEDIRVRRYQLLTGRQYPS